MVMVDEPLPGAAIEVGLKLTVVPVGAPLALSEIALLKLPLTLVEMVDVPEAPCTTVAELGDAEMLKSDVVPVQLFTIAFASTEPTPVTASYPVPQEKPVT